MGVNDQFAEEAFTVYDHPKVMIFQKTADYSRADAAALLGAVDLSQVVHLTPKQGGGLQVCCCSARAWRVQQAGGTWSQLFPPEGCQNRIPWLAC